MSDQFTEDFRIPEKLVGLGKQQKNFACLFFKEILISTNKKLLAAVANKSSACNKSHAARLESHRIAMEHRSARAHCRPARKTLLSKLLCLFIFIIFNFFNELK